MRVSVIIPCRNARPPSGRGRIRAGADGASGRSGRGGRRLDGRFRRGRAGAGARVIRNASGATPGARATPASTPTEGDLAAFLDADAVAPPDWIARARRVFESDGRIVGVGGRVVNGRPGRYGELDYYLNHSEWIAAGGPAEKRAIPTMAIVYRR